jgi:hypothetical protein
MLDITELISVIMSFDTDILSKCIAKTEVSQWQLQ